MIALVRRFHLAFGLPVKDAPTIPYIDRVELRRRLIQEEHLEVDAEFDRIIGRLRGGKYTSAVQVYEDIGRLTKELSDLVYVIEGTALEFGLPLEAAFAEVHRSNMSKLGRDGKPVRRHDGKVLKGPDYTEADMMPVLGVVEGSVSP